MKNTDYKTARSSHTNLH